MIILIMISVFDSNTPSQAKSYRALSLLQRVDVIYIEKIETTGS
jgi:hypothetical protein